MVAGRVDHLAAEAVLREEAVGAVARGEQVVHRVAVAVLAFFVGGVDEEAVRLVVPRPHVPQHQAVDADRLDPVLRGAEFALGVLAFEDRPLAVLLRAFDRQPVEVLLRFGAVDDDPFDVLAGPDRDHDLGAFGFLKA